jgi:Bax protein
MFKKIILLKNFFINKKINLKNINQNNLNKDLKNIYLTSLGSLVIVLIFFIIPLIIEFKNENIILGKEVKNNSRDNFEKTFQNKSINKNLKLEKDSNIKDIFVDILKFENLSTNNVRLDLFYVEKLFKDTNYNLKQVRSTKLVKPISLPLLPYEIKKIENAKKRKNLFIKIVLPLIIEENDRIKADRKKLFNILNKNHNSRLEKIWLDEKHKQYGVVNKDISTLKVRMDIIPVSLVIAQAAKESGWGTSRFAIEGNALFGQWTWSGEGIKPAAADDESKHKVMKFKVLQASIRAYQRNLNTHLSYSEFRRKRSELRDEKKELNSLLLANYLDKYAETGKQYVKILKKIIQQNSLNEFDDVKLMPSSVALKSLI